MTMMGSLKNASIGARGAALGGCLVLLGACIGTELDSARDMDVQGGAFNQGLYDGYIELASSETAEYDYRDSDGFAMKAKSAAGGDQVPPEDLGDWDIPEGHVEELSNAHRRLTNALDSNGRVKAPEVAARAQVMYDCWVQEQEEDIQPSHIAACRSGFYNSIVALEVALRPQVAAVEPEPEPEPEPAPAPDYTTFYIVYFDFNSAELTEEATRILSDAAATALEMRPFKILVYGHTDRSGSDAYNMGLADQRSRAAARYLIDQGAGRFVIDVESMGESSPAVQTADGVRDGRNRRVEITLEQ